MIHTRYMTFATLLKKIQKQKYPSTRAFALALGVDASRLSRAMSRRRDAQPFDVRGCLKLARVTGEDPLVILRVGGKGEIADLLAELLPTDRPRPLTSEQQIAVDALGAIPDAETRAVVVEILRRTAESYTTTAASPSQLRA